MDLKIIKPHQCSLERSHVALIELTKSFAHILNYEFYRLHYIVKIFLVKYQWLATFHQ